MLNTILLAMTGLITALTPVLLAIINRREKKTNAQKAARLEEMHAESMSKVPTNNLT